MARKHVLKISSEDEQDIDDVWEWYDFQRTLIGEESARVISAISVRAAAVDPRYFGMARDEINRLFDAQRGELDLVAMLILMAAIEAALRVDYVVRVGQSRKDSVSKEFAALYRIREHDIRLEEHLLDVWKHHSPHPEIKAVIGEFKGVLHLRHWLAHGRYWKPRSARKYDPHEVFEICDNLLTATGIR